MVRNSDAYISNAGKKLIQITSFLGSMILISKEQKNFNWAINFLGSNFNYWNCLYEKLQLKFLSYLNGNELIKLCYVPKYFRKLVLKKFAKIHDISTGFCSVKYWTNKIERNVFELIQAINNDLFESKTFDFEENYDQLIKKFRHMSLFSFCLQFFRCRRSCEKKNMAIVKFVPELGIILFMITINFQI